MMDNKAKPRTKRIDRMRKMAGIGKAVKLVNAGMNQTMLYGADVLGMPDANLTQMMRTAGQAIGPKVSGRSLELALYMADIPIEREANLAPLMQWHKQVWLGCTDHTRARALNFSLARLKDLWAKAKKSHPNVKTWGGVVGPVSP